MCGKKPVQYKVQDSEYWVCSKNCLDAYHNRNSFSRLCKNCYHFHELKLDKCTAELSWWYKIWQPEIRIRGHRISFDFGTTHHHICDCRRLAQV